MIYMPAITHMRPVNMQFKACMETGGQCSFPQAHVTLNEKQRLLMQGQEYKVGIKIDMPESPNNQDLGMFMVCSELKDADNLVRAHTCRSAMLEYKSPSIRTIQKLMTLPMILMGFLEENQSIAVEVFPKYVEDVNHPITDVYVEIQSHKIEFYK
uniref:Seipin n=1 Tax=Megaselia scalaris TaxID=36166 RepID=T1GEG5_MEGSC